jgi:hypothetical protein
MFQQRSENGTSSIFDDFLVKGLEMFQTFVSDSSSNFIRAEAHAHLAQIFAKEYEQISSYMTSEEFKLKLKLAEEIDYQSRMM